MTSLGFRKTGVQTLDKQWDTEGTVIKANKMGPDSFSDPEVNGPPDHICPAQLSAAGWPHPNHLVRLGPSWSPSHGLDIAWRSKLIQVQTMLGTAAAGQQDSTDTTRAAAANVLHLWRGCPAQLWVHTSRRDPLQQDCCCQNQPHYFNVPVLTVQTHVADWSWSEVVCMVSSTIRVLEAVTSSKGTVTCTLKGQ